MEPNLIQYQFVLNKKSFPMPFQFRHYNDISQNIISTLVNSPNHQYHVKTKVNEEIFQNFINYLIDDTIPHIDEDNFYYYYELCDEFNTNSASLDLISRTKPQLNQYIINIKGLRYCEGNILKSIEDEISRHLDEYLIEQGEMLMNSPIQILFNIFNKENIEFEEHDLAYDLIKKQFERSQDSSTFILLDFIEGSKLTETNLSESISLNRMRYKFMPRIDLSYISGQFKSNSLTNEIHEQRIEKLDDKTNKLSNEIQRINNNYNKYLFIALIILLFAFFYHQNEIERIKQKNSELSNLISNLISHDIEKTNAKQRDMQLYIEHINSKFIKFKDEFHCNCDLFTAKMSMKSPGILSILKSKEKSIFDPLFIASRSSNDAYDLIQDNGESFHTLYQPNFSIEFEIYENVTISGCQIFTSILFFPKSFDVEIEGKTVI